MKVRTELKPDAIAPPPDASVALIDDQGAWSFADLQHEVQKLNVCLKGARSGVLATLMDNSPAWVVADLAAAAAQVVHVPLPTFFTTEQIAHALHAAGVDMLLAPAGLATRWPNARLESVEVAGQALAFSAAACDTRTNSAGHRQDHLHLRDYRRAQGRVPGRGSHLAGFRRLGARHRSIGHSTPSVRATLCGAVGEHRRPACAAGARCYLHYPTAASAGADRVVPLRSVAISRDRREIPAAQPDHAAANAARLDCPSPAERTTRACLTS